MKYLILVCILAFVGCTANAGEISPVQKCTQKSCPVQKCGPTQKSCVQKTCCPVKLEYRLTWRSRVQLRHAARKLRVSVRIN